MEGTHWTTSFLEKMTIWYHPCPQGDVIADHSTVLANLQVTKPPTARKKVSVRKIKTIHSETFGQDLLEQFFKPQPTQ